MAAITFKAKLWAPMEGKGWTFVTMPKAASAKLGRKGRVPVEGTINGHPFRSSAFPDGQGSHQIQVNKAMRDGAQADVGDTVSFKIEPSSDAVQVEVPADLQRALDTEKVAKAQWRRTTPKARAEWVAWVTSAKKEDTRARRVQQAVDGLAEGKKRPKE